MASRATKQKRVSERGNPISFGADARATLLSMGQHASVGLARAMAARATHSWWARVGGGLLPPAPPPDLPILNGEIVEAADAFAASLGDMELGGAAHALGGLYAALLPGQHRSQHGVFYTPRPLVSHLLDRAELAGHDWSRGKVVDPSAGAGAFAIEGALRMVAAMSDAEPALVLASISARLRAWDLDPFACWMCQMLVEAVLLPLAQLSNRRLGTIVECRDSLAGWAEEEVGEFSLVMGNPAFGKVKDTPAIRARFRRSLRGHPNLYGLFTDLAVHLVRVDGLVAWLTPTSWLAGDYFRNLRSVLAELAPPVSLDFVSSREGIFEGVLQEVVLSVFGRGRVAGVFRCGAAGLLPDGSDHGRVGLVDLGDVLLPADTAAPWQAPRDAGQAGLVRSLSLMPMRLRDWGWKVSTGPLVWNRHRGQLHATPGDGRVPVVWAEAVTADCRFTLTVTKARHADKAWYQARAGLDGPAADLNVVDTPCVLVQRTTSREQHRRIIAAELPASALPAAVENHLNMVKPIGRQPAVPAAVVAAFLASGIADRVMRCISGSVAVSAAEIESLPLPPAAAIVRAANAGTSNEREVAFLALYGMTP